MAMGKRTTGGARGTWEVRHQAKAAKARVRTPLRIQPAIHQGEEMRRGAAGAMPDLVEDGAEGGEAGVAGEGLAAGDHFV